MKQTLDTLDVIKDCPYLKILENGIPKPAQGIYIDPLILRKGDYEYYRIIEVKEGSGPPIIHLVGNISANLEDGILKGVFFDSYAGFMAKLGAYLNKNMLTGCSFQKK